MVSKTRRLLRYGGKKKKSTRVRARTRSSPRRRTSKVKSKKGKYNSWGLNKGTSKGCVRVCLGSTLR